jgi:tetratricopeptide (TPR) repeat protein
MFSERTVFPKVQTFVAAGLIILLAAASLQRNVVWNTKLSLWTDAAAKSFRKSRSHNNLGNCYMLLQKPFSAIEEYKIAVSLDPKNIEAYYNLALNFENVGILNQALYYYTVFCKSAPPGYRDQVQFSCERVTQLAGR